MQGMIGRYQKPNGSEEMRVHFPTWRLPDGRVLRDVTIFPHLCETCMGGHHTHVEINDRRERLEIIGNAPELGDEHRALIDRYLTTKVEIDEATDVLASWAGSHPRVFSCS